MMMYMIFSWIFHLKHSGADAFIHSPTAFAVNGELRSFRSLRRVGTSLKDREDIEGQRLQLGRILEETSAILPIIEATDDREVLDNYQAEISKLSKLASDLTSTFLPPMGLSSGEYVSAIELFARLPYKSRIGLVKALGIEDSSSAARDFDRIPEIVSLLYEKRSLLTPEHLKDSMEKSLQNSSISPATSSVSAKLDNSDDGNLSSKLFGQFSEDASVEQLLPRVTRKENRVATEKDLQILTNALDNKIFITSGMSPITGGYVLRGENRKGDSRELLDAIDAKLPRNWDCQVAYLPDFTSEGLEIGSEIGALNLPPVLTLLKKDMTTTTNPFLLASCTTFALITAVLFCFGVYGSNELVTERLGKSDMSGLAWFNGQVLDIFLPLFLIQSSHELSQVAMAKKDGIKTGVPALYPFWGLPLLGPSSRIKESPRDRTVLFDYAFIGPVVGLVASLFFLGVGLQATGTATNDVAQYFPALPVSTIKMSTAGSTLLDEYFGGAGSISLQDPATPISLHPWAVAGYAGLIINALELMPLGATDGGRIALSLFGRQGALFLGGGLWVVLLITTLFGSGVDSLLGAWLVFNLAQKDLEVPARDEVVEVSAVRAVSGFLGWFVMVLILTPVA